MPQPRQASAYLSNTPIDQVFGNTDLVHRVLICLSGVDALRCASVARVFRDCLSPDAPNTWSVFYAAEFVPLGFSSSRNANKNAYRRAYRRLRLDTLQWRAPRIDRRPPARQGAACASCPLAGGIFVLCGGYTTWGISADLHVLHRAAGADEWSWY